MKKRFSIVLILAFLFSGCVASKQVKPGDIIPPDPIVGNGGEYMCPYTQDGVVALWVDKSRNAGTAASIGKVGGAYAGAKLVEQVPLFGSFLGAAVGDTVGRTVAIEACGGWEYIKETSDLSFNSLEEMSVWLYATKSDNEHYNDVFKATTGIYPKINKVYSGAIANAPRR